MKILIMAGGQGTRFWPRSVKAFPKQFLALTSDETMLQQTYRRFLQWLPKASVYVATVKPYVPLVSEQLPELDNEQLIVEPEPKDTGPCIAISALHFLARGDDEVLVITPSDQYIPDGDGLREVLEEAERIALNDRAIVTLAVAPTRPETGYGYIRTGPSDDADGALVVEAFIEKPPMDVAEQLIRLPNVYWNSGIFIWKPSTIAYYMERYQKEMWSLLSGCDTQWERVYAGLPKLSVDYAILEKAEVIHTIPVCFEWDDVGSWTSLERIYEPDADGNIVMGDVNATDTENSIIYTENRKTLVIGVKDLIIVSTKHGLLICDKGSEQRIKQELKYSQD